MSRASTPGSPGARSVSTRASRRCTARVPRARRAARRKTRRGRKRSRRHRRRRRARSSRTPTVSLGSPRARLPTERSHREACRRHRFSSKRARPAQVRPRSPARRPRPMSPPSPPRGNESGRDHARRVGEIHARFSRTEPRPASAAWRSSTARRFARLDTSTTHRASRVCGRGGPFETFRPESGAGRTRLTRTTFFGTDRSRRRARRACRQTARFVSRPVRVAPGSHPRLTRLTVCSSCRPFPACPWWIPSDRSRRETRNRRRPASRASETRRRRGRSTSPPRPSRRPSASSS